jgi:hypothetical protein
MCDPITIAKLAITAASTAQSVSSANTAANNAATQAQYEYAAARDETIGRYREENRQISDAQQESFQESSDEIRKANEALGTMLAAETALTDGSFMSLVFEESYGGALALSTIEDNLEREIAANESNKKASEQAYINRTRVAQNKANNVIAQAQAQKTGAYLSAAGSGLSIGADQVALEKAADQASGATVRSTGQIIKDWF